MLRVWHLAVWLRHAMMHALFELWSGWGRRLFYVMPFRTEELIWSWRLFLKVICFELSTIDSSHIHEKTVSGDVSSNCWWIDPRVWKELCICWIIVLLKQRLFKTLPGTPNTALHFFMNPCAWHVCIGTHHIIIFSNSNLFFVFFHLREVMTQINRIKSNIEGDK